MIKSFRVGPASYRNVKGKLESYPEIASSSTYDVIPIFTRALCLKQAVCLLSPACFPAPATEAAHHPKNTAGKRQMFLAR